MKITQESVTKSRYWNHYNYQEYLMDNPRHICMFSCTYWCLMAFTTCQLTLGLLVKLWHYILIIFHVPALHWSVCPVRVNQVGQS